MSPEEFRGCRPWAALPPANIWQPFRLLLTESIVLALNAYRRLPLQSQADAKHILG